MSARNIEPGEVVIAYLAAPREQVFGVVLALTSAGVVLRGISLTVVDDWLRSFSQERGPEGAGLGLATSFYPMHRIEKVALDEPTGGVQPIQERFCERVGTTVQDFVAAEGVARDADDGNDGS